MLSLPSTPSSSPRSLALEVSNLEGQFTEVVRKKRKTVERSSGPSRDRGRKNLFDFFNKL